MISRRSSDTSAFTFVELLITIGIIAIIVVAIILVLNPAELIAQSRDARRVADMASLNGAVRFYQSDQNGLPTFSLGNASSVYVSLPDTTSNCANLGLPALPAGYTYNCVAGAYTGYTKGTGWLPVNFSSSTTGSPILALPSDPKNQSSTGLYYIYYSDGSQFMVAAIPESQKTKLALAQKPIIPNYPGVIANGTNLTISPLYSSNGLVGYWPLDEGAGSSTIDASGNGKNGTFGCIGTGCFQPSWTNGKIGAAALSFNPIASTCSFYLTPPVNVPAASSSQMTLSLWMNPNASQAAGGNFIRNGGGTDNNYEFGLSSYSGGLYKVAMQGYSGGFFRNAVTAGNFVPANAWSNITLVFTQGQDFSLYVNGVLVTTVAYPFVDVVAGTGLGIGGTNGTVNQSFSGSLDDVRVYNRALSVAEIQALYNAEK